MITNSAIASTAALPESFCSRKRVHDEVREHVGLLERPALGEQVDLPERLEREDRADDDGEEDRRREQRHGDVAKSRPRARAVDLGGFEQVVGHRLQPGRHEDEAEAEVLPDRRDTDASNAVGKIRILCGLFRIGGEASIPSHGSKPTCGLSSVPKITDATATEVATVDEKIVR